MQVFLLSKMSDYVVSMCNKFRCYNLHVVQSTNVVFCSCLVLDSVVQVLECQIAISVCLKRSWLVQYQVPRCPSDVH